MAIGLDIGSSAVRAAEVDARRGGEARLIRYGEVPLPAGAVVDGDVVELPAVARALRELWGASGIRGRDVAVGLASQRVTVRQIDLPDLPDTELAEAVRLQAQDQLPIPVDQAELDFVVVERRASEGERRTVRVLVVAVEREMVERLLSAVTEAKLRPVVVDLEAFALVRSLAGSGTLDERVEALVDVGAAVTKIAVHRGGRPLFVRMVRLGGEAATRQLQNVLELPWEEAEKAKLGASAALAAGAELDPDDERARALDSAVRRLVSEVGTSLEYFRSQHEGDEVERLLLSGGASLTPNLSEALGADLGLPVEHGDPLRTVPADRKRAWASERAEERPFLAVPVGLAMGLLR